MTKPGNRLYEKGHYRAGIIGCGFFAQFQIEAWRRMPDVELVCACDLDIAKARQAASRAYTSAEEMLANEEVDFVDIATRPDSHLELVKMAAERGIAAICQKPAATTWQDAVAIVEAAERAGVPFMFHENWRWQPWFREVSRRISAGDIGEPIAYGFRTRKRDGFGADAYPAQPYFRQMPRLLIYETLVHQIDTAMFLFGGIRTIYAHARRVNPLIRGEDRVVLVLAHDTSVDGYVDGHRFADLVPESPLIGDASFEGAEGTLHVAATGDVLLNGVCVWRNEITTGYRGDSVLATQQHFIECLRTNRPMESGGRAYLKTVACVEAAYLSLQRGARVAPGETFPC